MEIPFQIISHVLFDVPKKDLARLLYILAIESEQSSCLRLFSPVSVAHRDALVAPPRPDVRYLANRMGSLGTR